MFLLTRSNLLKLTRFAPADSIATESLTLTFEQRQKSRLRTRMDSGRDVGIILPRGSILHDEDRLIGEEGIVVAVKAALEHTSTIRCEQPLLFARACYHLGNRHVSLQIGTAELRYLYDPVLDEMLRGLGLTVTREQAPFEPEPGAYASGESGHHAH